MVGWAVAGITPRWVPAGAVGQGVPMSVSDVIAKIVSFLRAGYPQGVPATDTFALLALLCRRCRRSSCHSFVPPGFTA